MTKYTTPLIVYRTISYVNNLKISLQFKAFLIKYLHSMKRRSEPYRAIKNVSGRYGRWVLRETGLPAIFAKESAVKAKYFIAAFSVQ